MDYFILEGTWWLPDRAAHSLPGTLTFDADGLSLVVYGSLVPTVATPGQVFIQDTPDWTTTPAILGRAHDRRRVTLLEAGGANLADRSVVQSTYRIRTALIGAHVTADRITEAWCEFDCLNAWAQPPSLTAHTEEPGILSLRFKDVDLSRAEVGDAVVRLVARVFGRASKTTVHVEQRATFAIEMPVTSMAITLRKWIRPLQDLLILALGRPVRLTALYVRPDGADPDDDLAEVSFEAIQPAPGPEPDWSTIISHTAPTLLTFGDSPLAFADLLLRWLQLRSELPEVFVLLHGQYYAPFMFSEHRYHSIFQSAEVLAHAHGLSGREKSRADHRARVAAIISAAKTAGLDDEAILWAERILRSRNDKPLAQQIQDLVSSTGEIGEWVLGASPDFGQVAAGARTGVSHGGALRTLDAVARHWHGDVLRWVIRAKVLMDLGIENAEVERRVLQRAGFQHAVDQIRVRPDNEPPSS